MDFLICIAGLPRLLAEEVRKNSPARFTETKSNLPIIREMNEPYAYRPGMSDFFLGQLAKRLEIIPPEREVGIGVAYASHGGGRDQFLKAFFPFAAAVPFDPSYPGLWEKRCFRAELASAVDTLALTVDRLRERILLMRDVLSGQNFSPLTLPLRNFRSEILHRRIAAIYDCLGTKEVHRGFVEESSAAIREYHPLNRLQDGSHRPFFQDDRGLRFRSPGRDNHGVARVVGEGHLAACLINGRARLGGPLRAGFHYDCERERGGLDPLYPNCHDVEVPPSKDTHVNIAPSDAIR